MSDFINYLAIGVTSSDVSAEELARQAQEAQARTVWLIVLGVLLVAEIFLAFFLPKFIAKKKAEKQAKAEEKARRKAIQSKRKRKN